MMKIAIIGSRDYSDYNDFKELLISEFHRRMLNNWQLISGGASGVDNMAERFYNSYGITNLPPIIIRPNYQIEIPKIAPLIRNREIARQCDLMIAFWNGLSGGTANAIAWATFYHKEVVIFEI